MFEKLQKKREEEEEAEAKKKAIKEQAELAKKKKEQAAKVNALAKIAGGTKKLDVHDVCRIDVQCRATLTSVFHSKTKALQPPPHSSQRYDPYICFNTGKGQA